MNWPEHRQKILKISASKLFLSFAFFAFFDIFDFPANKNIYPRAFLVWLEIRETRRKKFLFPEISSRQPFYIFRPKNVHLTLKN